MTVVLAEPTAVAGLAISWLILGGTALFIAGHLIFKLAVWRRLNWPRTAALVVLALLGLLAPHVSRLTLGCLRGGRGRRRRGRGPRGLGQLASALPAARARMAQNHPNWEARLWTRAGRRAEC